MRHDGVRRKVQDEGPQEVAVCQGVLNGKARSFERFEEAVNRALAQPDSFGNVADPIQPVRHADQNVGSPGNRIDQPWTFHRAPTIPGFPSGNLDPIQSTRGKELGSFTAAHKFYNAELRFRKI